MKENSDISDFTCSQLDQFVQNQVNLAIFNQCYLANVMVLNLIFHCFLSKPVMFEIYLLPNITVFFWNLKFHWFWLVSCRSDPIEVHDTTELIYFSQIFFNQVAETNLFFKTCDIWYFPSSKLTCFFSNQWYFRFAFFQIGQCFMVLIRNYSVHSWYLNFSPQNSISSDSQLTLGYRLGVSWESLLMLFRGKVQISFV